MTCPYQHEIEARLGGAVREMRPVGGGSIARTALLKMADGQAYFVKWGARHPRMFPAEARGLHELSTTPNLTIPRVIHVTSDFLLMTYLTPAPRQPRFFEHFGRALAGMHARTRSTFGFDEDNFIGHTPQPNIPDNRAQATDWPTFYLEKRLLYQWQLARANGLSTKELDNVFERFAARLPGLLAGTEEEPALLHGDLWSGNFIVDRQGLPALIDPAVYYGHREAELGMTTLFGGFPQTFYDAYNEALPLVSGWRERLPLYELYHLFNHLNLFGGGYYNGVLSILKKYGG
ncbi:MAG: fructosamine kinase [Calditrichaeota bacterium]|nr:MAG: fructosamine kinase [Calditrichota bacterium]